MFGAFDGTPTAPQNFNTHTEYAAYDIQIHQRDHWDNILSGDSVVPAQHAPDCTFNDTARPTHDITDRQAQIYLCANHMMTVLPKHGDGYNEIIITPSFMADVTSGSAVIGFDVSTHRSSTRDWWDMMISDWDTQTAIYPVTGAPDIQTTSACRLAASGLVCDPNKHFLNISNGPFGGGAGCPTCTPFEAHTDLADFGISSAGYLADSATVRDHFELTISQTTFSFCKTTGEVGGPMCFFTNQPHGLTANQLVIQWGHHGYTPDKGVCFQASCGCTASAPVSPSMQLQLVSLGVPASQAAAPLLSACPDIKAGSYHWDNFDVDPGHKVPFTIIHCTPSLVVGTTANIHCNAPAPVNASLRFSTHGAPRVGGVLVPPKLQMRQGELADAYFYPVAQGSQDFTINLSSEDNQFGSYWYCGCKVKDVSIFARGGAPSPTPTPIIPTPTSSPSSTSTTVPATATSTPTPQATATAVVPPTATSVPPTATSTSTPLPPSPTATSSPVPLTATSTPLPPTPTRTSTPIAPFPTPTPGPRVCTERVKNLNNNNYTEVPGTLQPYMSGFVCVVNP